MAHSSFDAFLKSGKSKLVKGPIAIISAEDDIGVEETIQHHARIGFKNILLLALPDLALSQDCQDLCHRIDNDPFHGTPFYAIVNKAIAAFEGRWLFYCHNTEYLMYPFCEDRSVEEMLTFIEEERRGSAFTYVVDLYASDINENPYGFSIEDAYLDSSGYYALERNKDGQKMDRQLSIYGGVKWRFEEHLPKSKLRIDRVSLFKAKSGLKLDEYHIFNHEEYNTYQCPWHHSITVALCSFRTAKYLKSNPGSTFDVDSFVWAKSQKFKWESKQLMDLGLMEPGQWF